MNSHKRNKPMMFNRMSKVDMRLASPKKAAVIRVLKEWPDALRLQFTICHCRQKATMVSFQLPDDVGKPLRTIRGHDNQFEQCGFFCSQCKWSNAGSREIVRTAR